MIYLFNHLDRDGKTRQTKREKGDTKTRRSRVCTLCLTSSTNIKVKRKEQETVLLS